jgi:glycine cleavage system P protein (glycine dehydrogenase) subunit 1
MSKNRTYVHPYIPNSVPSIKKQMLKEIGVKSVDELYQDIPKKLRLKKAMNLPDPLTSEFDLKRHVEDILNKNKSCDENVSFLGGGCYPHYVPAICDEINHRSEFLTAYAGEPYEDHGRFQSLFEYQSLMAELLDVDVVNVPTFDWAQAASTTCRMAQRITKRNTVLISKYISPDRLLVIKNYCHPMLNIEFVDHDKKTGQLVLSDLKGKLNKDIAGLYFENPSYLGFIETQGKEISSMLMKNGSLMLVGCDPISLGILETPSNYGADITCGEIQSLGMHMAYGGANGGFIASKDDEKIIQEYPSRLFGISKTEVEGEWGFGDVLYDDRTSFGNREEGKEFVGTASALWGITAAVYLSLMGPKGMYEVGQTILQKSQFAANKLNKIKGVKASKFTSANFKEFVVDFNKTGKTVKYINAQLLKKGIFGGKDLSNVFAELGESALFCITETHSEEDINKLADTLKQILI